ncbi:hypothetical protein NFI96_004888, partial [Prochilodus magdalenae]
SIKIMTSNEFIDKDGLRFGSTVKPSVSLLPPSSLQLSGGSASLLCLLSGYSPQGAQVSWTVGGSEVKEGVLTSGEEEKNGRYSRSSTLTLSKALWDQGQQVVYFKYNSETGHMQKFSDHTAIVACVRGGQEAEYRTLVEEFVAWCHRNNLLLNTSKTKEMVVDFHRARPLTQPVSTQGVEVERVKTYRYLGLHLDDRLDWSANTDILYRKGQSRLSLVCWGGSVKKRDKMRLDKLVRRAGSVAGLELDSVVTVAERRTLHKLLSIMDDDGHPLHTIIMDRRRRFSGRLLSQSCSTDRLRRSFVIRLYNSSQRGRKRDEDR